MPRQRIHVRRFAITELVMRLLVTALAAAIVYYGAMVVLGAFKARPDTLNEISAYRTVFDQLSSIAPSDITGRDRVIVAIAGVVCLLVFAPLAWRAISRPYLARSPDRLDDGAGPGRTEIGPRAYERLAEIAALRDRAVARASARSGADALDVQVQLSSDLTFIDDLRHVQERVREAIAAHGLPDRSVDVTFAGVASDSKGELA
jgi:hypothetical protein